jgi:hypothetical protein
MPTIKDLVWIEKIEGKDKPRYHNVGIYMKKDDGKESIKLNVIPGPGWNGWLSIFEKKEQQEAF